MSRWNTPGILGLRKQQSYRIPPSERAVVDTNKMMSPSLLLYTAQDQIIICWVSAKFINLELDQGLFTLNVNVLYI